MVLYCLKHDCGARLLVLFTDFRLLTCPRCHVGFKYSGWESESVPSPFVDQSSLGCAIIIKPTRGDFLSYGVGDDLHIGISNSMSVVHSYWMNGISSECAGWDKSIVVCRFDDYEDRFDVLLSSFLRENAESFEGEFYDDSRWNCFDFAMEFLRFINFRRYTKIDFVSEFVQSSLNSAVKYNMLVRRVKDRGIVLL
uniref:Permuted papain-like amidase enzyme, YaeF/YiiX, C92 family n=1 Tax=Haemonchus contortus TaxID=6289 RepID=A0A7I4Y8T4_HAECO